MISAFPGVDKEMRAANGVGYYGLCMDWRCRVSAQFGSGRIGSDHKTSGVCIYIYSSLLSENSKAPEETTRGNDSRSVKPLMMQMPYSS